jgi:hypothetical protein
MKKLLVLLSISLLFLVVPPVWAQDNTTTTRPVREQNTQQKTTQKEFNQDNLKARAKVEINRRIESLKKLLTRLNEFKKLSPTQKTALTTKVQAEIDTLNSLLIKIDASTDTQALRSDVQSIVTSYRVYALFIPQIEIIGAADRILTITDQMYVYVARLEGKLTEAKDGGKDVSALEPLVSDMKVKIAEAQASAQEAIDTVTPLTPAGFPENRTTLQQGKQSVQKALRSLKAAQEDARKIVVGWLKAGVKQTSVTPQPRLSCVPRPKCLESTPACKLAVPAEGWCPASTTTTPSAAPTVSPTPATQ